MRNRTYRHHTLERANPTLHPRRRQPKQRQRPDGNRRLRNHSPHKPVPQELMG